MGISLLAVPQRTPILRLTAARRWRAVSFFDGSANVASIIGWFRPHRGGRRSPITVVALLCLLAAVLLSSCAEADYPPMAKFRGQTYISTGSPFDGLITEADLQPIGEVESTNMADWMASLSVYRLNGVDPAGLFLMRDGRPGHLGEYVLFWRFEAWVKGEDDESPDVAQARWVLSFPGLCAYYPAGPCP
jgi:hypothetical protein